MSKTDIRLLYQKDSGLSLDDINKAAEFDDYVAWLEEQLEASLSVGERLMRQSILMGVGNETSAAQN